MPTKKNKSKDLLPISIGAFEKRMMRERDQFNRKLLFIAYLFERLGERGVTTYLVGGQAVELYTGGQFTTGDIDITSTDRKATVKLLEAMKFVKTGMIWLREGFGIAVQIVGNYPSATEKSRTIEIAGVKVNVVGVEDLIINRLVSAKFWRSNPKLDLEEARVLWNGFKESLDAKYLRKGASDEHVSDYLGSVIKLRRKSR